MGILKEIEMNAVKPGDMKSNDYLKYMNKKVIQVRLQMKYWVIWFTYIRE